MQTIHRPPLSLSLSLGEWHRQRQSGLKWSIWFLMVFEQHLPGRTAVAKPRRLDSYPLQIRSWKDRSVRRITGATDKTHDGWILLAASVSGSRCCASRDLQGRLKRRKPLLVLQVKAVLFQIRRGYVKDLLEAIFFFQHEFIIGVKCCWCCSPLTRQNVDPGRCCKSLDYLQAFMKCLCHF